MEVMSTKAVSVAERSQIGEARHEAGATSLVEYRLRQKKIIDVLIEHVLIGL
jgi:hypothetical protein